MSTEISFDTYEIDYRIFIDGEYTQKSENNSTINKFKLLSGLTHDEIQKKEENSNYDKYFSTIATKNFNYIGVLTNQLKRDKYGYSIMDNKDEYFGEYKDDVREGFGIYKFSFGEKDDVREIYIGNYKNNKKEGEGMYLKIDKCIQNVLINFNSGLGIFENDVLKSGKIYTAKDGINMLYQGKINDKGEPEDDDALIFEEGNKIFKGKISNNDMNEGRNIILNEKYEKINAYYFYKKDNKYDFDYSKKEEVDEECVKKLKENPIMNYGKQIQNIYNEINNVFNKFKDYDNAIKINFENDIKNKIKSEIDKIMK